MRCFRTAIALGCALAVSATFVHGAGFEPAFRFLQMHGKCTVKAPDADGFVDAELDATYRYNTAVRTGPKSWAVVALSAANTFRIGADSTLVVGESMPGAAEKIIDLTKGSLEVALDSAFRETARLKVRTASAVCEPMGTKFSVDAITEGDLQITVVQVDEGAAMVSGDQFAIKEVGAADKISVSSSRDNTFTRIKCESGDFQITVRDAEGATRQVDMVTGSVVKIWRRLSDDGTAMIVTVLISAPDGTILDAITYSTAPPVQPVPDQVPTVPPGVKYRIEPLVPTTTTTTTTTTLPPIYRVDRLPLIPVPPPGYGYAYRPGPTPTPIGRR